MKKLHIMDDDLTEFNDYINAKAKNKEFLKRITFISLEFELETDSIDISSEELRVIRIPATNDEVEKLKNEIQKKGIEIVLSQKNYWVLKGKKNSTDSLDLKKLGYSKIVKKKNILLSIAEFSIAIIMLVMGAPYIIEYATHYLTGILIVVLCAGLGIYYLIGRIFFNSQACNGIIENYERKTRKEAVVGSLCVLAWIFVLGTWLRAMAEIFEI